MKPTEKLVDACQGESGAVTFHYELPAGCPPDHSILIAEPVHVYRFVAHSPPTRDDFRSQRELHPDKAFSAPECIARGLSVFHNESKARRVKGASRDMKLRSQMICKVTLNTGAGHISPPGSNSHSTWWHFKDYPILASCVVLP